MDQACLLYLRYHRRQLGIMGIGDETGISERLNPATATVETTAQAAYWNHDVAMHRIPMPADVEGTFGNLKPIGLELLIKQLKLMDVSRKPRIHLLLQNHWHFSFLLWSANLCSQLQVEWFCSRSHPISECSWNLPNLLGRF